MGLEPTLKGWKPRVLPLHYIRILHTCSGGWTRTNVGFLRAVNSRVLSPLGHSGISSSQQELHPRHPAYKTGALLAELCERDRRAPVENRTRNRQFTKLLHCHCAAGALILFGADEGI